MGLFRRKKKSDDEEKEEEYSLEEKVAGAKKRAELARAKAETAKSLKEAKEEIRKAKQEEFRAKHHVAYGVTRGVAGGAKDIVTTVITSRKLGPEGKAGVGRKYRQPKPPKMPKGYSYRPAYAPRPHEFGHGHTNPNLYGFSEYPQQVNKDGSRDLFGGGESRNRDLFGGRREDLTFRNPNDASTNLINEDRNRNLFSSGDKKNLDYFGSNIKKKQRLF